MTPTPLARRRAVLAALSLPLAAALPGCAAIAPQGYADQKPPLDLKRYFDGMLDGWGMVQDRSGKVLRRFTVTIRASWQGDTGTLDEAFVWSDGERQRRVWTLRERAASVLRGLGFGEAELGALEKAMATAAASSGHILCHELYVTANSDLLMVLMSHAA